MKASEATGGTIDALTVLVDDADIGLTTDDEKELKLPTGRHTFGAHAVGTPDAVCTVTLTSPGLTKPFKPVEVKTGAANRKALRFALR
ncbi:MAG: hypothetical protein IT379_30430 [Deltaproteobacteria bacterium]|nr:hypothetical protein [Deltaproteobacteria bacterium]